MTAHEATPASDENLVLLEMIGRVAVIRLNRPRQMYALSDALMDAFGLAELKLAVIPGAGGTQRLPRAISKAKAMDMCMTARNMDAAEAERSGLVSRVVAAGRLMDEAMLKKRGHVHSARAPVSGKRSLNDKSTDA